MKTLNKFSRQAILTRFIAPTNTRGSRVKASCARGSLTISLNHGLAGDEPHIEAADALVAKFLAEDKKEFGQDGKGYDESKNPWAKNRVTGCLPNGDICHTFVD